MPLTTAPSPHRFAESWGKRFGEAVRDAAGTDGRLSRTEARKVAGPYADNAAGYLDRTGQKSVSVAKLIGAAEQYAYVQADKVAGGDGRVSLADGAKLAGDLRLDFFQLRGKDAPVRASVAERRASAEARFDASTAMWNLNAGWRVTDLVADNPPASLAGTDLEKATKAELADFAGVITYDQLELYRNPNDGSWMVLFQQDGESFSRMRLFDEYGRAAGMLRTYDDGSTTWSD